MRRRRHVVVLMGCLAACQAPVGPRGLDSLPWAGTPADETTLEARRLLERGKQREALSLVEEVLAYNPVHVDARRVRQDVLRERGRRGLLVHEAQAALAATPGDPLALYLAGRVAGSNDDKLRYFEAAAAAEPASIWPWLGVAHTLRRADPERSLQIYERLQAVSGEHPLVEIAYAAMLQDVRRYEDAARVYDRLRGDARVPGVGDLGLAQCWAALDRRHEAWTALMAALRQRPADPGVQLLLRGWMQAGASAEQVAQAFDVLREDPERLRAFSAGGGDGPVVLAELLQRTRQSHAALSLLTDLGVSARQPGMRRLQRQALLGVGDIAGFLRTVREDIPLWLVGAETNQLRDRWLRLLRGPWYEVNPLASADQAVALLEALRDVGWLVEVELLAEFARPRWPDAGERIVVLRDEVRRELAFEAGVRRLLYHGYAAGDRAQLPTVLERLRELSVRILGADKVGAPEVYSLPMIGEMVDPLRSPLAQHFDRYNRHFVLGQRSGGTVEGMLLTRLSLAELPSSPELELVGRCHEVIAIDRDLRALAGVLGGDMAGVALLNHFLIDFDAVREWARGIADRRRIAAEDDGALLRDPLPADVGLDPLDTAWRLALMSPVRDTDLDAAVLDTIRHHERQHLIDAFHYLPIESNLWRGLGLMFEFAWSPAAIEAEMERRAELASLAVSPHTELVLAHIADFLAEPDAESPHHQGFAALGSEITAQLQELGVSPADAAPSRWHLCDRELVRQAARRLLERLQ